MFSSFLVKNNWRKDLKETGLGGVCKEWMINGNDFGAFETVQLHSGRRGRPGVDGEEATGMRRGQKRAERAGEGVGGREREGVEGREREGVEGRERGGETRWEGGMRGGGPVPTLQQLCIGVVK